MAMMRYSSATVIEPCIDQKVWSKNVCCGHKTECVCGEGSCRVKTARTILAKYSPEKYLLSHCTIIAAVDTELANPTDPQSDYFIHPAYSKFINNNGDAWSKSMLASCYRSFIGSNNYCFPAGTRILMSDGTYKLIELIKENDKVINRKGEISKVSKTFSRQTEELIELSSTNILSRSLYVTPDHPLWVYSARETCPKTGRPNHFNKEKDFFKLNDWIGFSVGVHKGIDEEYPCGVKPDWKKSSDIDSDRDFFTHPVSSVEIENSEINANRAELIGWFLAEGSYKQTNNFSEKESGIIFNLGNEELNIVKRLSDLLKEEFGDCFRIDCKPRVYEAQTGSYTLSLSNEKVALFFKKWCGKYSWAKRLPEEALWLPKSLQLIILKSCICGDGCGEINSRGYSIELKTQKLIQQFLFISWRLGLSPIYAETGVLSQYTNYDIKEGFEIYTDPITGKKSRPGYMLRFSVGDSKKLNVLGRYEDLRISNRKSKKIARVFSHDKNNYIVSKINSTKRVKISSEVFNIEVEGDNSYIAEGIIVHNCEHVQIPELSKGKVVDAILREVPIGKDKMGKDLTTYYVDILVATDRKHKDLIGKIQAKELSTLSMGCKIAYSICSKCGKKAVDETEACQHVRFEKNNTFYDNNGTQRKVGELCLPWNNKVLKKNGEYDYIENVRIGDEVISHKGYPQKITDIFQRYYSGNLVGIKAEGLSRVYESTPEHPFYVFDGEKFEFRKAEDLKLSDFLVSFAPVEEFPLKDLNEKRAMLLGLYAAEGCCYNEDIVEFILNPEDEQDLAQEIISTLESEFSPEVNRYREKKDWEKILEVEKINPVRRSERGEELLEKDYVCLSCGAPSDYVVFHETGRTRCKVCGAQLHRDAKYRFSTARLYSYERKYAQNHIGDRPIKKDGSNKFFIRYKNKQCFEFFTKYCSGKRSFLKNLHEDIIYAPRGIQKIILSNWLRGDGSIDNELRLRGYTTSENLFRSMEILAARLGYWTRSQVVFNDQLRDLGELRKIRASMVDLLDDKKCHTRFALFFSPRDSGDLCVESGFVKEYPLKRRETRKKDGYSLHKIRCLSNIPFNGDVYNLAVEKDNSYIVDGVVTHNCGHFSEPESVTFIDASWVENPAFTGAVVRNIVNPPENIMAKLEEAEKKDSYVVQDSDFLKAAHKKAQDEPPKEDKADEPPKEDKADEPPKEDKADEPATAEEPAVEDDAVPGDDAAPEEAPAPETPAAPEAPAPEPESPVKTWKKDIKKKLLDELSNDLVKEFTEETEGGANELETLDESLIQPTASSALRKMWLFKKGWENYLRKTAAKNMDQKSFDRLRFGTYMILTSNDLTALADYGFNRRDFLAIMSYLDQRFKRPLSLGVKKALVELNGSSGLTLTDAKYALQKLSSRKLDDFEMKKALTWLKAMDSYQE